MVHLTKVTDALTLCLNGHSIRAANHGKAIVVANGGALTLTDCIGAGKLIHTSGYAGTGVCILTDGTFTMYSGIITGNNSLDNSGGVYNSGTFKLYGGSITYNEARQDSGVFLQKERRVNVFYQLIGFGALPPACRPECCGRSARVTACTYGRSM